MVVILWRPPPPNLDVSLCGCSGGLRPSLLLIATVSNRRYSPARPHVANSSAELSCRAGVIGGNEVVTSCFDGPHTDTGGVSWRISRPLAATSSVTSCIRRLHGDEGDGAGRFGTPLAVTAGKDGRLDDLLADENASAGWLGNILSGPLCLQRRAIAGDFRSPFPPIPFGLRSQRLSAIIPPQLVHGRNE